MVNMQFPIATAKFRNYVFFFFLFFSSLPSANGLILLIPFTNLCVKSSCSQPAIRYLGKMVGNFACGSFAKAGFSGKISKG